MNHSVYKCKKCHTIMHLVCYEQQGACSHCKLLRQSDVNITPKSDFVCCKFCSEAIKRLARECEFCGELQRKRDRIKAKREEELNSVEILFAFFCSGWAFFLGVVWVLQGKKKGSEIIKFALVINLFVTLFQLFFKTHNR